MLAPIGVFDSPDAVGLGQLGDARMRDPQIGARRAKRMVQDGGNIGCAGNESDRAAPVLRQQVVYGTDQGRTLFLIFRRLRRLPSNVRQTSSGLFILSTRCARLFCQGGHVSKDDSRKPERLTDALRRQPALQQRPAIEGVNRLMRAQTGGKLLRLFPARSGLTRIHSRQVGIAIQPDDMIEHGSRYSGKKEGK